MIPPETRSFAGGGLQLIRADLVSGNYFDVLGVDPILGRALNGDHDRSPGNRRATISPPPHAVNN